MRKILIAGTALAALFQFQTMATVSVAQAADLAVPPPASCLWCGFYLGANAGWALGRNAVTTTTAFAGPLPMDIAAVNASASPTLISNGLIGGGEIGYN